MTGIETIIVSACDKTGVDQVSVQYNSGEWLTCHRSSQNWWTYEWDTSIYPDSTEIEIVQWQ